MPIHGLDLQQLHDKLLSEGCNRFYIEGPGGPMSDDVDCLGFSNGNWIVYYTERGQESPPVFSSPDMRLAIEFYCDRILKTDHWHLLVFTRSLEIFNRRKAVLDGAGIATVRNDIPDFKVAGDRIYRLFVLNKAIFRARELLDTIPYFDEGLKP